MESTAREGAGGMRPTGVDTSVDSPMDEASGAGGTRGEAAKRAMRLRRTSSTERAGVVMLVTVVVTVVATVVVTVVVTVVGGCPS